MPYSPKHKQDTRERILESARRLFNSKGFSEVSIGEIMTHGGLTHGGFLYGRPGSGRRLPQRRAQALRTAGWGE